MKIFGTQNEQNISMIKPILYKKPFCGDLFPLVNGGRYRKLTNTVIKRKLLMKHIILRMLYLIRKKIGFDLGEDITLS